MDTCNDAREFLQSVLDGASLNLSVTAADTADACVMNMEGEDASYLLNEGGELLDSLQHLTSQIFGRELGEGKRIVCDIEDFRATRESELRAMANHAAGRVRSTGAPFLFGPMTANERRVIHTVLANETDLHTESVGDGAARRLRISPK